MAEIEYGSSGSTRESVMDYFDIYLPSSLLDQFEDRVDNSWAPVNGLTPWESPSGRDALNKSILAMASGLFDNVPIPRYPDECGFKKFKFDRIYKSYDTEQSISDGVDINISGQSYFSNELTNRLFRHKFMSPLIKASNPSELEYYNSEINIGVTSTVLSLLINNYIVNSRYTFIGNKNFVKAEEKSRKVLDGGTSNRTVMIPIMISRNLNYGENAPNGIQIDVNAYNTIELDQDFSEDLNKQKIFNGVTFLGYKKKITGVSVGGAHSYNNDSNIINAIRYTVGQKSFAVASTVHCEGNKYSELTLIPSIERNANLALSGLKYDKLPKIKRPTEFFVYINKIYEDGGSYYIDIFVPDKTIKVWNQGIDNYENKNVKDIKISNISKASAMISVNVWNYIDPFSGVSDEKNSNPKTPMFDGVDSRSLPGLLNNNKNLHNLFINSITGMSTYGVSNPVVVGSVFLDTSNTFCGSSIVKDKFSKGAYMVIIVGIQYNPYLEDDFIGSKVKSSFMSYINEFTPSSSRYDGSLSQIADMFGVSINFRPIGGKTDVFEA